MSDYQAIGRQTKAADAMEDQTRGPARDEQRQNQPDAQPRDISPDRIQCTPSVLSPTDTAPANSNSEAMPPRSKSIDTLAHTLSRQGLQLEGSTSVSPRSSPALPLSSLSDVAHPPPGPTVEVEVDRAAPVNDSSLHNRRDLDSLALPPPSLPSAMDTDPRSPTLEHGASLRERRDPRLTTTANPTSSRQTAQSLLEDMVFNETQCNVRSAPLPPPPLAIQPGPIAAAAEPSISVDPSCLGLEVDEAYCEGNNDDEELSFMNDIMAYRRGTQGGMRSHGLLRYRPSADAGLRCSKVVRNRPRMRKRPKLGPNSKASSAVSSAISSPVIPPSIPDEQFF